VASGGAATRIFEQGISELCESKSSRIRCSVVVGHLPVSDHHLETALNSLRISAIACIYNILLDTSPQFQAI